MKTKYILLYTLILVFSLSSCGNKSKKGAEEQKTEPKMTQETQSPKPAFDPATLAEEPVFIIKTTEGDIKIKLYKDTPKHRDNFVKLASERFYDDILFHRVIRNFMDQTGDPLTKDPSNASRYGTGGPGYTVPAEILPTYSHKFGAIAAARRGDQVNPERESSGSQFYIVNTERGAHSLDGDYTVFGETIDGLDVVKRIGETDTRSDRPIKDIKIISILPE